MGITINCDRAFQLWEYHVSHGCALVRSPRVGDETSNIDIMLFGVEYLAVPRHLIGVQVKAGTREEQNRLSQLLGRSVDRERVWALVSGGIRHLVVAAKIDVRETEMDIFDSPF